MSFIKTIRLQPLFILIFLLFILLGCQRHGSLNNNIVYVPLSPKYDLVSLEETRDTLHIPLSDDAYNAVSSFNLFKSDENEYISFLDRRSKSVICYDLSSQHLIKEISIENIFKEQKLTKFSMFFRNFDSIYIIMARAIFMIDSTGRLLDSIPFAEDDLTSRAVLKNNRPLILKNGIIYTGLKPSGLKIQPDELKEQNILSGINTRLKKTTLLYNWPAVYLRDFYGYNFLNYSYCYNDRGNFVFSFAADTCIYETDLSDFNKAYLGKSMVQRAPILPIENTESKDKYKIDNFLIRDSYSSIYFDPHAKRYLRVARIGVKANGRATIKEKKKQRVIIFDESFHIIGESELSQDIIEGFIFITYSGAIYGRVLSHDDYALHFVRLQYTDHSGGNIQLTRK